MKSQYPDPSNAHYMGHNLGEGFHEGFAIRVMRAYFAAEPPKLQQEHLARVRRIVAEHPQSYLARIWRRVYLGEQ